MIADTLSLVKTCSSPGQEVGCFACYSRLLVSSDLDSKTMRHCSSHG